MIYSLICAILFVLLIGYLLDILGRVLIWKISYTVGSVLFILFVIWLTGVLF